VYEGGGSEVVGVVCWTCWKTPEILLVAGTMSMNERLLGSEL